MRVVYWLGFLIRVPVAAFVGGLALFPTWVLMVSFKPRDARDTTVALWDMFLTLLLGEL
jgi:hypothetical protein